MILSLDQTKVNMSNFTRINDVKEKVYCENLISSEETDSISDVPKNQTVNNLKSFPLRAMTQNTIFLIDKLRNFFRSNCLLKLPLRMD